MNNILFIAPDDVGIIKIVQNRLSQRTDFTADFIDFNAFKNKFVYKNFYHRVANFISKNFKKVNLKDIHYNNLVKEKINTLQPRYSRIVIIRPDLLNDEVLGLLRSKTESFIANYWDSISLFDRKLRIKNIFDKVYSFDTEDCKRYGFDLLTNFYYFDEIPATVNNNVYCLLTNDKRTAVVERMGKYLNERGIANTLKVFCYKPAVTAYVLQIHQVIPYEIMLKEIAASSVLVEIQKEEQQGLTFRPFEALGLSKKLITNNKHIKEYDFYDANNICIIDNEDINIPNGFFTTPYRPVSETIKIKYHLDNWIETLFIQ